MSTLNKFSVIQPFEVTLKRILDIAASGYPNENLYQALNGDKPITNPELVGDDTAFMIARDIVSIFSSENDPVLNLSAMINSLGQIVEDVSAVKDQLLGFVIRRVLYDYLVWLHNNQRQQITLSLFKSWIHVHDHDAVRAIEPSLVRLLIELRPVFESKNDEPEKVVYPEAMGLSALIKQLEDELLQKTVEVPPAPPPLPPPSTSASPG